MADKSKIRMNLTAIKKVDPYAKDIIDSSAHVAFYTFGPDQNEWEKTDVEGAFFIYSRNAQPFHSIFINNRLNSSQFVEPITNRLELQLQAPFLLYRNERSRIRGFWFYNSQECDRIGNLVSLLITSNEPRSPNAEPITQTDVVQNRIPGNITSGNINIFNMLSSAQQEFNVAKPVFKEDTATCSVEKFFAAARPASEFPPYPRAPLPNTLSLDQIEKQQRVNTPHENTAPSLNIHLPNVPYLPSEITKQNIADTTSGSTTQAIKINSPDIQFECNLLANKNTLKNLTIKTDTFLDNIASSSSTELNGLISNNILTAIKPHSAICIESKPALMPPTMFGKKIIKNKTPIEAADTLNQSQFIEALKFLIQNDKDFVQKLHEAYLKSAKCTY